MKQDTRLLLHNIRSVYNVGAIFRTADALGVSKIYLSGYTPAPLDRFGNVRKDFAKSALGSEKFLKWEYVKNLRVTLEQLKDEGFNIIAVEQAKKSVDYKKVKPVAKSVVVFGSETSGVPKKILDITDGIAEIPMRGNKESLNVSVSAGIVLFRWFDD